MSVAKLASSLVSKVCEPPQLLMLHYMRELASHLESMKRTDGRAGDRSFTVPDLHTVFGENGAGVCSTVGWAAGNMSL